MKSLKFTIIVFMLCNCFIGVAQQLPQFTQYMYNTISINPAYAGSREVLSIVAIHRSQWVGLDGGPTTQTLSAHLPLRNNKIGVGLSVINDELGFENFTYIYGDFSYTVRTGQNTKLAFGIKGGITQYSLDNDFRISESDDPLIFGVENRWGPNFGAGAYWHSNRWYLGLSAPRILNTDNNNKNEFKALERVSYYFNGGYVFDLNQSIKFKPTFLVKATNGAPVSIDLTGTFLYRNIFWFGGSYRINENAQALGGLVDFQVTNKIRIGYAYEYPLSDLRPYTSGTHEIFLMFELIDKRKRIKSPRYF